MESEEVCDFSYNFPFTYTAFYYSPFSCFTKKIFLIDAFFSIKHNNFHQNKQTQKQFMFFSRLYILECQITFFKYLFIFTTTISHYWWPNSTTNQQN